MNKKSLRLKVDFKNKLFLEFYGALLGNGWLSAYKCGKLKKRRWIIGFSGDIKKDREYIKRINKIVKRLFKREGYIKYKPKYGGIELNIGHKELIHLLNRKLNFPIGLKKNLKIDNKLLKDWNSTKYIIRGLFDTDGGLFFDKDKRYKKIYPIVDITTTSKALIKQLVSILKKHDFKVIENYKGVRMKGESQMKRWFKEIQPKNSRHVIKYKNYYKLPG